MFEVGEYEIKNLVPHANKHSFYEEEFGSDEDEAGLPEEAKEDAHDKNHEVNGQVIDQELGGAWGADDAWKVPACEVEVLHEETKGEHVLRGQRESPSPSKANRQRVLEDFGFGDVKGCDEEGFGAG